MKDLHDLIDGCLPCGLNQEPLHRLAMGEQYGDEWEGYMDSIQDDEDLEGLTVHRMPDWLITPEYNQAVIDYPRMEYNDFMDDCF